MSVYRTIGPLVKVGTKVGYDKLCCVTKNQPHIAYQSLYLSIFSSPEPKAHW